MEISAVISEYEFENLQTRIDWHTFEGKRILITGATGMVGSWLTTALLLGVKKKCIRDLRIDALVHSGNITNLRALRDDPHLRLLKSNDVFSSSPIEYDIVIHAASPASPQFFRDRASLFDINVGFLRELLSKSQFVPDLIYFSTGEVYGAGHTRPVAEDDKGNIDETLERAMYPLAKMEAEKFICNAASEFDLKYSIFRLFHTFGPGMRIGDGRSFADFIWDGALNKKPKLYSTGSQIRSFLYLEDMVAAVLGMKISNSIINVGSNIPVSIRDFAETVSHASGLGGGVEFANSQVTFQHSPNDVLLPNISLLESSGWKQQVSLADGISRSIEWARR